MKNRDAWRAQNRGPKGKAETCIERETALQTMGWGGCEERHPQARRGEG